MSDTTQINLRLSKALLAAVDEYAQTREIDRTSCIRLILQEAVKGGGSVSDGAVIDQLARDAIKALKARVEALENKAAADPFASL